MDSLKEIILQEALSLAARRKMAVTMRRIQPKIQKKKDLMSKRMAPADVLLKRARKKAHSMVMKAKILKMRSYDELSYQEKEKVEELMRTKYAGTVDKVARKIFPSVKKAEVGRFKKMKSNSNDA
jgi:hypothetical protein